MLLSFFLFFFERYGFYGSVIIRECRPFFIWYTQSILKSIDLFIYLDLLLLLYTYCLLFFFFIKLIHNKSHLQLVFDMDTFDMDTKG